MVLIYKGLLYGATFQGDFNAGLIIKLGGN